MKISNILSHERNIQIQDELKTILGSRHFANAPTIRAFLEYIVNEAIAGRGDRIKAYAIASEVFGKGPEFDPVADTIVRTTAGRVRKALHAYDLECEPGRHVVIGLPKGGNVPAFEFVEPLPPPDPDGFDAPALHDPSAPIAGHAPIDTPPSLPIPTSRRGLLAALCILALVAIGGLALHAWKGGPKPLPTDIAIAVRPVQYDDQHNEGLARAIDARLASALSRIGLAEIYLPTALPRGGNPQRKNQAVNEIAFILRTNITDDSAPELRWQLVDAQSGRLVWAAKEMLSDTSPALIDKRVQSIAFKILGEGGAVPLVLAQYHGDIFSKQACLSRAQLVQAVEDASVYPNMRECLERTVAEFPNDPSAWAILSSFYTARSRYWGKETHEEQARMVERAKFAASKAEDLAPDAYLTKFALMYLAVHEGNIARFDVLQEQLRATYPGNIYLKLRIANSLARLGRSREALAIYDEARTDWNIDLDSLGPSAALAYFAEGDYERALSEVSRTPSDQRYVLILKAAILGKLGMTQEARPIIARLAASDPDIRKTCYPWLIGLHWARPLSLEIADGLAKAGLQVETE